jgi:hypothetical protein
MAQLRVRIVNFNEGSREQVPELRKRLLREARVDLQCEAGGYFMLTIKKNARLPVMKAILEEFGFEFIFTTDRYEPDWSKFRPIDGCDCNACTTARQYLAAQKKKK